MKQSARFPLPYRIWIGASGGIFAIAFGLQLFFSLTDYGFLHNEVLLWFCMDSFIILLVGLTVWLCHRRVYKRVFMVAACVLLILVGFLVFSGTMFFSTMAGQTRTGAWSISGNRHYMHTSPEGTNRFVIMFTGMDEESIYAYPMLNRWIYKEVDNGFVWEAHVHEDEYTVEWTSESLAVAEVKKYSKQTVEGENLDNKIVVDFGLLK